MFQSIRAWLFSSMLLLATLQMAPASGAQTAEPPFAHQRSDLKPEPGIVWGRLDNGMRYALMSNAKPKGRASLRFGVMAGSLEETEAQRGLAHFIEHLAFNGSRHFPSGSMVEYFQRLGLAYGADTNAATSFDRTLYQLELPDTKPETLRTALTLFSDFAGGLLLTPEAIDKERGIILSEARDRDSDALRSWQVSSDFMLPEGLITRRLPIGLPEVIRTAQREQFVDYYDTWYRPENIVVVAVGDFDAAKLEAQLKEVLSPAKARAPARARPDLGKLLVPGQPMAKFHRQPEAAAVSVTISDMRPYEPRLDTAQTQIEDLPLNFALAMVNRRFGTLAKRSDAAISGGQLYVSDTLEFYRSVGAQAVCSESTQWRDCLATVEQEVRRAVELGFQPEELAEVAANFKNMLTQSVNGAANRNSGRLSGQLMQSIMERRVFTSPEADLSLLGPAIAKITPQQCAEALRKLWEATPGRFLFVSGNIEAQDRDVLAAYTASLAVPVKKSQAHATRQFAYVDLEKLGEIARRKHVDDVDFTLIEFKNGVRLNLKPTAFDVARVMVNVRIGGGLLSAPRDQPGLAMLVSQTFVSGGLGKHDIDDLRSLLAGKSLGYSFAVGTDAFMLGGTTTPDNLLLQLQVLRAFITDPGYRPEAIRQFHQSVEQSYTRAAHSLSAAQEMEIPRLLASGDTRFGLPADKRVLLDRSYEEARAWLTPELTHGAMEIAIVGDIDVNATIDAVAKTFGTLPARQPKPPYAQERKVSWPKQPIAREYKVDSEFKRGLVDIRWPTTDRSDIRRARRFMLLTEIFSDRLRVKLREQMGQTYSPSVQGDLSDVFPGYGFIAATASVAPGQTRAVADVIKEIAKDLARNGVTADEFSRARQPTLARMRDSERQNVYWMSVILQVQESPQRLEWHRSREADFDSITAQDITALAKQYLDPSRASEFISVSNGNQGS